MRLNTIALAFLHIVIFLMLVSSCTDSIYVPYKKDKGIETIVRVTPRFVTQGDNFKITLTYINHGPESLSLESEQPFCPGLVISQGGITFYSFPCQTPYTAHLLQQSNELPKFYLEPGQEYSCDILLSTDIHSIGIGTNDESCWDAPFSVMPQGRYELSGGLDGISGYYYSWDSTVLWVTEEYNLTSTSNAIR